MIRPPHQACPRVTPPVQPLQPCIWSIHRSTARSPKRCKAGNSSDQSGNSYDSRTDASDIHHQHRPGPPMLPAFMDGINWYCYSCLGLLFLTDLTPVGQWLVTSSSSPAAFPVKLAVLQWAVFVLPTLLWLKRSGWDLRKTLKLQPCSIRDCTTGLMAGPVLWLCINAAVALRTGNTAEFTEALTGAGMPAAAATCEAAISPGMLLLGVGSSGSTVSPQQVLLLLTCAAVSPAVAEELLFRGLLLTAAQQRLGNIDALAVVAALFALIHLDPQQFFLYCVLGAACGLAAVRSGSVMPAIVLHAAFNGTAVVAGLLVR